MRLRHSYNDFYLQLLQYLYAAPHNRFIDFKRLIELNGVGYEAGFVATAYREMISGGLLEGKPGISRDEEAIGRLTGEGLRHIEARYLHQLDKPFIYEQRAEDDQAGVRTLIAPAADRVVQFDHNAPDAIKISKDISEIFDSVRGANGPEIHENERVRVQNALQVAKQIWDSGQFKIIQLKVGIILAIEDAAILLSKTTKHVAAALLVDTIKSFIKNHLQVDLEAL